METAVTGTRGIGRLARIRGRSRLALAAAFAGAALLLAAPPASANTTFEQTLKRVDEALETNPAGAPKEAIESCRAMRKTAVLLNKMGRPVRGFRRLKGGLQLLGLEE